MAKIAFILLCHKDPEAIVQQAEQLTAVGDYLAIHFDASAPKEAFALIEAALGDNPNVVFAKKRIKCGWGEWSLVQATLYAVEAAVDAFPRATHFYMVSGDCMAIKSASYAKNLSVPGTDPLYGSLFVGVAPVPETSDSFDLGVRYQTGNIQAQVTGWYNRYNNRLVGVNDPVTDRTITRNLGKVEKYGIDGSIAWQPAESFLLYVFGSYLESEIAEDVAVNDTDFAATAGKREAGAPRFTLGARGQAALGPLELGAQIKRTGSRFLNDINTVELPGYTVADLDARLALGYFNEDLDKAYIQINVTNLLDEVYIGSAPTDLTEGSQFVNIGSPRAFTASLIWGF